VHLRAAVLSAATISVALLAGCAGGSQGTNSALPTSGMSQNQMHPDRFDPARSGVLPRFLSRLHFVPAPVGRPQIYAGKKDLYVSDAGTGVVDVLANKGYKPIGTISSGLAGPDGDFLDKAGNLYVANYAGPYVEEYAPGGSTPSFTYSTGMADAVGVGVDGKGNVYEADYSASGFVNEYKQGSNTVLNTCLVGGNAEGVAVDAKGDVFVDYNLSTGGAKIAEYKKGLKGCHETVLGVSLSFAGGMVLDKASNLVVCDQQGPTVDVIAPPYSSVTRTIGSGFSDPFHVTLSLKNKLAFVADVSNAAVYVINYTTGAITKTLNSANGITDPYSAVDGPNAVY
jgi:hypothetical protein